MKKILILSASTGAGHVRAGQALEESGRAYFPDATIEHIDIAPLLSPLSRTLIVESYNKLTGRFPKAWGFLYTKTKHPRRVQLAAIGPSLLHKIDGSPIKRLIEERRPDHIIATHFLPPLFSATDIPTSIVITDFGVHPFWLAKNAAHYFVSTEKMRNDLIEYGIPADRIVLSGIPISPSFSYGGENNDLRKKYGLDPKIKILLVLSGGYGLLRTDRLVEMLREHPEPLTIISIAGKNTVLKTKLEAIDMPSHIRHLVIGWTDTLSEYMHLADIVVGKPGGLTTTECIALQKPLLALHPLPGHEDANVEYLEKAGYGKLAKSTQHLLSLIGLSPNELAPGYKNSPAVGGSGARIIWETLRTKW